MTRAEYQALTLEERLEHAERFASVVASFLDRRTTKAAEAQDKAEKLTRKLIREADLTGALESQATAARREGEATALRGLRHELHSWQHYTDTPAADLAFPV